MTEFDPKTYEERFAKCDAFFKALADALGDKYIHVSNMNPGIGDEFEEFLVPVDYMEIPINKPNCTHYFRLADTWNWYDPTDICPDEDFVQARCTCLPSARPRTAPGEASKPVRACVVAYWGDDNRFHPVYGEVRSKGGWFFKDRTPEEVISYLKDKGWM